MTDDPYDYDDDLEDECFHDEYEIDILTGIASCDYCGLRWMLTREQFERQQELQVEYDRQVARWEAEGAAFDDTSDCGITGDEIPF